MDAPVSQVGFSAARRRTSARTPAGMTGRPGRVCWPIQRLAMSWRCLRKIVEGVISEPVRRLAGSSRARAAMTARSVQLIRSRGTRPCSTARSPRRVSDRVHKVRVDQLPDQGPLNHGRDRALNSAVHTAVHTIAMTRMRCCPKSRPTPPAAPPSARPPATLSSGSIRGQSHPGGRPCSQDDAPVGGRDRSGPVTHTHCTDIHLGLLRRTCVLI